MKGLKDQEIGNGHGCVVSIKKLTMLQVAACPFDSVSPDALKLRPLRTLRQMLQSNLLSHDELVIRAQFLCFI